MKTFLIKFISILFSRLKSIDQSYKYRLLREKYDIHKSFKFNGDEIVFYGEGDLIIGENTYIGRNSTIEINKGNKVEIGRNCSLSHYVKIYTSTNNPDQNFDIYSSKEKHSGNVIIGNGVWIGANVFINPGITIGDNSVIGANSVVTKNIEANSIVGGVPAKLIRMKSV